MYIHDGSKGLRRVSLNRREISVVLVTGAGITEREAGWETLETE